MLKLERDTGSKRISEWDGGMVGVVAAIVTLALYPP